MAAASPAAASRPAALIPISVGPARIQGWERSTRTGAGGAVGVSPQPTARISAASPALVERLPTGSTSGLRRELTHRQRDGGFALAVDRDFEAIRAGVRERHVEHEDRTRLAFGPGRGRLPKAHTARPAEDLGALLVHQPDLDVVLADLGALALEAQHQVQPRVHRP